MVILLSVLSVFVVIGVAAYRASTRRYQDHQQLTMEPEPEAGLTSLRSDHEFLIRDREPVA
jgi:hypothetical protein